MSISRREMLVAAAATAMTPSWTFAQTNDLASKLIRIIVAYGAGGASDSLARYAGDSLTRAIGRRVIVENRPGADGNIAAEAVVNASGDEYMLLVSGNSTHAANATIYKHLPFDPEKDFTPLAPVATVPYFLVVNPEKIKAENFQSFLAAGLKAEQPLVYASANVGGRLAGELLKKVSGLKVVNAPYRNSGQAMTDLLGAQYDYYICDAVTALPQIQSNKIRALAVTSKEPAPMLPQVPPLATLGYPDFDIASWIAIWSSAKTPAAVSSKLSDIIVQAFDAPEGRSFLLKAGLAPMMGGSEALRALQRRDTEIFRNLIIEAGMQRD